MTYKIVFLGNSGIGKSTMCNTKITKNLKYNMDVTIGAANYFIGLNIRTPTGLQKIKMDIWDTAGQEKYRSIASIYYRSANAVGLVFDLTDLNSFLSIKNHWIEIFNIDNGMFTIKLDYNPKPVYVILIGTKCDLKNIRIDKNIIDEFCKKYKLDYIETSSYSNINIDETFLKLATNLYELNNSNIISENNIVALTNNTANTSYCYCF